MYRSPYRMTAEELAEATVRVEEYLKRGWIRESDSPWGSPMLFVRKPSGGLRLVIDYRQLNAQTQRDGFPLPLMDELLQNMAGKRMYSKMDLVHGYHQVCLSSDSAYRTAFTVPFRSYIRMGGVTPGTQKRPLPVQQAHAADSSAAHQARGVCSVPG